MMGYWDILKPTGVTNLCTNPSFETGTTGWAAGGTGSISRSANYAAVGAYSCAATYGDDLDIAHYAITFAAEGEYTLSCSVYVTAAWNGGDITISSDDLADSSEDVVTSWVDGTDATGAWKRISTVLRVDSSDLTGTVTIYTDSAPSGESSARTIYFDAVQIESGDTLTTYCDGDQSGCTWFGERHASKSIRDAHDYRGGQWVNFADDMDSEVRDFAGAGQGQRTVVTTPLALLPGDEYGRVAEGTARLSLLAHLRGDSLSDFHATRQTLARALMADVGRINEKRQRRTLRYTGATVSKTATVVFEGGMELMRKRTFNEEVNLTFVLPDPYWYSEQQKGAVLSSRTTATARYVLAKEDGVWGVMGPPNVSGTYTSVEAICAGADGDTLYIGGDFTNFDNIANADYIVQYTISTGTYAAMGTGMNGIVYDMCLDADGDLIAVGAFTTAGGTTVNRVAKWDGSSWSAMASGITNTSYSCCLHKGVVHVTNNLNLSYWDGSSWQPAQTFDAALRVVRDIDGVQYVGGDFTSILYVPAIAANYIAVKDATGAWGPIGDGLASSVRAIAATDDGTVFAGGTMTGRLFKYEFGDWTQVGELDAQVKDLIADANNAVHVAGDFASTGDYTVPGYTIYSGGELQPVDFSMTTDVHCICLHGDDVYLGLDAAGTVATAQSTTITYNGTAKAYPVIEVHRSGGTDATLYSIRNETTGANLTTEYELADDERLIIDLRPGYRTVTSTTRGNLNNPFTADSDFAQFYLMPGIDATSSNEIVCFVDTTGSPTVTVRAYWHDAYLGVD